MFILIKSSQVFKDEGSTFVSQREERIQWKTWIWKQEPTSAVRIGIHLIFAEIGKFNFDSNSAVRYLAHDRSHLYKLAVQNKYKTKTKI